jgi:hypothetical protein
LESFPKNYELLKAIEEQISLQKESRRKQDRIDELS